MLYLFVGYVKNLEACRSPYDFCMTSAETILVPCPVETTETSNVSPGYIDNSSFGLVQFGWSFSHRHM